MRATQAAGRSAVVSEHGVDPAAAAAAAAAGTAVPERFAEEEEAEGWLVRSRMVSINGNNEVGALTGARAQACES